MQKEIIRSAIGLGIVALICSLVSSSTLPAAAPEQPQPSEDWADWVESDFPFFSSVLDARHAGPDFPTNNLTPRGLVLRLGRDHWVGFDIDLLRVAAIWRGNGVTPKALAPGSYHDPDRKTPGGQFPAPEPDGKVWLANGIYPGWQTGASPSLADPREPAPSPEEVGRGPLPEQMGRFRAVRLITSGAVLEYTAGGADVREWMTVSEQHSRSNIERHVHVGPSTKPLWLVLGFKTKDAAISLSSGAGVSPVLETLSVASHSGPAGETSAEPARLWVVRVPPHKEPVQFCAALTDAGTAPTDVPCAVPAEVPPRRWPQEVTSKITLSTAMRANGAGRRGPASERAWRGAAAFAKATAATPKLEERRRGVPAIQTKDAYVVDDIGLPLDNPWRRNVRLGDIQFLRDGTGVGVTLDGDVWVIRGLHEASGTVRWSRFASGLHEPLTLAIRDEQVYVFDRNGIWRLRDTNGDGEADVHELFSNAFAQTADMREFPNTLRLAPGGEFIIAKGNQQATTIGKHNGNVLRISADGRSATVLGYGFRQPNIGVNVRTGLVTASDQQGHYIPTTPLHIVKGRQFYGFLSDKQPREVYPAPIAEPLTWIPHAANASAMSQIWLFGARMGPLNDALVHIGFNRPELFRVILNQRAAKPQAAVVSITQAFEFPPLNGSVNPADGQLYLAGFQILGWGTTATRLAGLGRVRYTGAGSTIPREVVPMDKGVLLRFDTALDAAAAVDPDNYSITSWHYQRTYRYGSPQFKADGTPGIDRLAPSGGYLSKDGRSVFVGVPDMKPVMQMRLGWSLAAADGAKFQDSAYFTPYDLTKFDPQAEGFGDLTINLSPRAVVVNASAPISVEEGRRLSQLYGCVACHSVDTTTITKLGPTWKGLYGADRTYVNGVVTVTADEAYLRESILQPTAKIVTGYERGDTGMPSYAGVLTDAQIESIILFIKSLK